MIEFSYLYRGICGLARAHRANPLAGHLGAAVVAGYFFGEDQPDLEPGVYRAMEQELQRILQGEESVWYNARKAGITVAELFAPFPQEPGDADRLTGIAEELAKNIDQTRQSGHNVIFASIALRALNDHPDYATPSIVEGLRKLIAGFHQAVPGRGYYGAERGWLTGNQVKLDESTEFPPYRDQQQMAGVVIDELIRSASRRKQGYGGLFHLINHATGLTELARYGHPELARRGLAAHHQHVRLWRSLPDVEQELGALQRAEHDPRTTAYWSAERSSQWSAHLTHRIKTLYGFFSLLRFVEDKGRRKDAEAAFLYLMA